MKKRVGFVLCALICAQMFAPISALAAYDDSKLTWDGRSVTLRDIAKELGYDMVYANGDYKPLYYGSAQDLWNKGLLLGSDGSFNLDKPLTRVEGVIMTLRLLGREQEAKDARLPCAFTDVPDWAKDQVAYAAKNGIVSGYSATVFGANDVMTANQLITFVLRAMGYSDQSGDFAWTGAADKALEIGLIGAPCREQYMRSNLFLRDNAVAISHNALFSAKCKDGSMLGAGIVVRKPEGAMPYATAAEKAAAGNAAAESSQDIFGGTVWDRILFDAVVSLSFDGGEVTLRNKDTVKGSTAYTFGTYTVSGDTATFSGDITRTYTSAKINGSVLSAYFSTREGYADYTLAK
jgi:hypothetical protein